MDVNPAEVPTDGSAEEFNKKLNKSYLQALSSEMATLLVKKGFSNSGTKESFGEDTQANAQESTIAPK